MAINRSMWFTDLQPFFNQAQLFKRGMNATSLSAECLFAQVIAHQSKREGKSPNGMNKLMNLFLFMLHDLWSQQSQQGYALLIIQLRDGSGSIYCDVSSDTGKASRDQISAVRTSHFTCQCILDSPHIIDNQQHTAQADGCM